MEELPELPKHLERYVDAPYGGLFGNAAIVKIVQEIIADPTMDYRSKYLERLTGLGPGTIRGALTTMVELGLLKKDVSDVQHPVYQVQVNSKIFIALSFLAYAVIDDRDRSDCMDQAVVEYCKQRGLDPFQSSQVIPESEFKWKSEGKVRSTENNTYMITASE